MKLKIATTALALLVLTSGAIAQREREKQPDVTGKVVAVGKDGKSITLETPPTQRGGEPTKTEVKLGDKSEATYFGVGIDGAKPTEGYIARVWLADGSKDTAATVGFMGQATGRGTPADAEGKVVSIGKDKKSLTVAILDRGRRGEDAKRLEVKVGDKTTSVYYNVGPDKAALVEDMMVRVWLAEGSKDAAHWLELYGPGESVRRVAQPGLVGKVVAVGKDNKSITVEAPPRARGEDATKTEVKISDKTTLTFHNVLAGEAKLAEGMLTQVWLEENSKDNAVRIGLMGTTKPREQTVFGPVTEISKDGKSITLEQPPEKRGDEPRRLVIKTTDKTRISFSGVGPGEAKPKEGMQAMVFLKAESKDIATSIVFGTRGGRGR